MQSKRDWTIEEKRNDLLNALDGCKKKRTEVDNNNMSLKPLAEGENSGQMGLAMPCV